MYKNLILPASLLAGTIIGAGIFALPFVFINAGIVSGLFYLGIFCFVLILIHLMYAEVIIKTGGEHRFPGYAKIYLGEVGFWLASLTSILGLLLVLTVYLILSASFFSLILPINFGVSDILKILIFWLFGSAAIFLGVRRMALSEFLITAGIVLIAVLLFIFGGAHFNKIFSAPSFNLKNIFLPYGVILFSLMGRVAIPAVINYFQKIKLTTSDAININSVKKTIILGTLIPALVYLLFIFGVMGLSTDVSEDAVSGLINSVSPIVLVLVGIFGLISLWSSYIVVGLDIKNALSLDLKFPKIISGLAVVAVPLMIYFFGFQSFLGLVGIVGGIFISLEGIFIVLMWLKVRKPHLPIVAYILILVFIGGIVYKLIY